MLAIILTEEQYRNLGIFLSRVNLVGKEAASYLALETALSRAQQVQQQTSPDQQGVQTSLPDPVDAPAGAPVPQARA